jgi:hypothetical protein
MIERHSDIPLPDNLIKSLDESAKAVKMQAWSIIGLDAVTMGEGEVTGFRMTVDFLRTAKGHGPMGFKCKEDHNVRSNICS